MKPTNINSSSKKIDVISDNITYNEMDNVMKIYRAVIENNQSPKKDGRVQVRIYGIHDERLDKVKTEHLPWAEVMQSTAFGFNTGIGFSSVPNIGTWVFVILDHNNPNMPIVLGAISGKPIDPADPSKGFNHPKPLPYNIEKYIFPLDDRLGEEDQNRLQRVEKLDETIHKKINDTRDDVTSGENDSWEYVHEAGGIAFGDSDSSNFRPKTPYPFITKIDQKEPVSLSDKSEYPDNAVIETKSGHVIEIDDTPYNERFRLYHRTGSYMEFRPDGSYTFKAVSKPIYQNTTSKDLEMEVGQFRTTDPDKQDVTDSAGNNGEYTGSERSSDMHVVNHEIIEGHLHRHIEKCLKEIVDKDIDRIVKGHFNTTVDKEYKQHIKDDKKVKIEGNLKEWIRGLVETRIEDTVNIAIEKATALAINDNYTEYIKKSIDRKVDENVYEHIVKDKTLVVDGDVLWKIGGDVTFEIGGKLDVTTGGTQTNHNGGNYTHVAPRIDLNP